MVKESEVRRIREILEQYPKGLTIEDVSQKLGLNRVDLRGAQDLRSLNLNAPWHPFNDPEVAANLYKRRGSHDNCLFTVTSVAPDAGIAVGFPLTEDSEIYPPLASHAGPPIPAGGAA